MSQQPPNITGPIPARRPRATVEDITRAGLGAVRQFRASLHVGDASTRLNMVEAMAQQLGAGLAQWSEAEQFRAAEVVLREMGSPARLATMRQTGARAALARAALSGVVLAVTAYRELSDAAAAADAATAATPTGLVWRVEIPIEEYRRAVDADPGYRANLAAHLEALATEMREGAQLPPDGVYWWTPGPASGGR